MKKFRGQVHFYRDEDTVIKKIPITHIGFTRDLIVKTSIEKFRDNDPCIIHETYCRNILAIELQKEIAEKYNNLVDEIITIEDLPRELKEKFEVPEGTNLIRFV